MGEEMGGVGERGDVKAVASSLLHALRAPVSLRWTVELPDGSTAALSADVAAGATEWPPRSVMLQINVAGDTNSKFELKVPSRPTSDQLASVIQGGLDTSNYVAEADKVSELGDEPLGPPILEADSEHSLVQPQCV